MSAPAPAWRPVPQDEVDAVCRALGAWREIRDLVGPSVVVSLGLDAGGAWTVEAGAVEPDIRLLIGPEAAPRFLALAARLDDVEAHPYHANPREVVVNARLRGVRVSAHLWEPAARAVALTYHVAALVAAETARTPAEAA